MSAESRRHNDSTSRELTVKLQMSLRPGIILADETEEGRVIGRPYTTVGGKVINVRIESVKQTRRDSAARVGSHVRVEVKRTGGA